ncbi:hypothetical protein [Enterobacter kobei]|uniref:Uncharacterized protein n=2 Tax=Enterobacter kobei TaxID=208224 RepID=A0AA86IWP0_9ENTR|nr:hypothetical protein [Enterobacter kobei]BCU57813.1 hypothetical protein ENKO_44070 [Enterobacter kobei]SIR81411.1 hypothetical protein SAMN05444841_11214 [Enterobacter kobei]
MTAGKMLMHAADDHLTQDNKPDTTRSDTLWSLILLESDLVEALAMFRIFGPSVDNQSHALASWWAGYRFTWWGSEADSYVSAACADVVMSICRMAAELDYKEWQTGVRQAEFELSLIQGDLPE